LRTWLYRIATRACLNELAKGHRRVLPSGLGGPADEPTVQTAVRRTEVAWLEPIPDALIHGNTLIHGNNQDHGTNQDPASIADLRQSTRLALIAAMQLLPARQRAVLILRDVLAWHANEVAELLDTTTDSVNSSLLRSRAHLARLAPAEDEIEEPGAGDRRSILDRYVAAFENADITGLVALLHRDVELEMPPTATWFAGPAVGRFLDRHLRVAGRWRLLPVRANGQWAVAAYLRRDDGVLHAHGIHVLAVAQGEIRRICVFVDASQFVTFGMRLTVEDGTP
jgi:RNA polymerase sigma-70 factor (ECF subfamily)